MSRFLRWGLSVLTMVSVAAVVFVVVAPARADDPAVADCGEPGAATLAVVDCSGVDPVPDLNPKEAIRLLLGHNSWDFTAGTYLHLDEDDLPDGAVVGDLTASSAESQRTSHHMMATHGLG
jgi:hypothetical protein